MTGGNGATADRVTTRLIFDRDSLNRLGALAREILREEGAAEASVLLVTDAGLVEAGHAPRAELLLNEAGLRVTRYDACAKIPRRATSRDASRWRVRRGQT